MRSRPSILPANHHLIDSATQYNTQPFTQVPRETHFDQTTHSTCNLLSANDLSVPFSSPELKIMLDDPMHRWIQNRQQALLKILWGNRKGPLLTRRRDHHRNTLLTNADFSFSVSLSCFLLGLRRRFSQVLLVVVSLLIFSLIGSRGDVRLPSHWKVVDARH